MGKYDQCRHGEPEGHCASCAACTACNGECGTCPYAPPAPAVPDPTVETLSEAERRMLDEPIYNPNLDMHQRSDLVAEVAERILIARAAAPDSLGVATLAEALHEHRTRDAEPGYRFPLDRQPRDYRKRIEAEAADLWPAVQALINGTVGDTYDRRD